jgi:DNA-binding beta-propeller fold protein YncE
VGEYGGNVRVQKFDRDGGWLCSLGGPGTDPGCFQRPSGLVWRGGRVYVVDAFNNRVQVFADDGQFLEVLGDRLPSGAPELLYPYDIAFGPGDDLFIAEYGAGRVTRLSLEGQLLGRYGSTGHGTGQLQTPWGLTVDRAGQVWVADTGNRRIVRFHPDEVRP